MRTLSVACLFYSCHMCHVVNLNKSDPKYKNWKTQHHQHNICESQKATRKQFMMQLCRTSCLIGTALKWSSKVKMCHFSKRLLPRLPSYPLSSHISLFTSLVGGEDLRTSNVGNENAFFMSQSQVWFWLLLDLYLTPVSQHQTRGCKYTGAYIVH